MEIKKLEQSSHCAAVSSCSCCGGAGSILGPAQWVKDPALVQPWCKSQLWLRVDPWLGNAHMLQVRPNKRKKNVGAEVGQDGGTILRHTGACHGTAKDTSQAVASPGAHHHLSSTRFPGRQAQRWRFACRRFSGNSLRSSTWKGVGEAGLGRRRSQAVMQLQPKLQPIPQEVLELKRLFRFSQVQVRRPGLCAITEAGHWL